MRTGFELPSGLPPWLRRLLLLGVKETTPSRDAKHVVLTNALALLAIVLCLSGVPFSLALGAYEALCFNVLLQLMMVLVLQLDAREATRAACALLYGSCLAITAALTFVQPIARGMHFWLLLITLVPFVIFPRRAMRWALPASLLSLGVYLAHVLFRLGGISGQTRFGSTYTLVALAFGIFVIGYYQRRITERAEDETDAEHARNERLLLDILPAPIVARLKAGDKRIADRVDEVSVLFADLVGFTELADKTSPQALVRMLDEIFTAFDALCAKHGLEKIKTIGDAYMVAAGVPTPRADHAAAIVRMGLDMVEAITSLRERLEVPIAVRVGVHSGAVVAGVIGTQKLVYDLWGDVVNTASRMESHGVAGAVHVSDATRALLPERFELVSRGALEVKGKGVMTTHLVRGERGA